MRSMRNGRNKRGDRFSPRSLFFEQTFVTFFRPSIGPFAPSLHCPSFEIHKVFLRLVHLAL